MLGMGLFNTDNNDKISLQYLSISIVLFFLSMKYFGIFKKLNNNQFTVFMSFVLQIIRKIQYLVFSILISIKIFDVSDGWIVFILPFLLLLISFLLAYYEINPLKKIFG